MKILHVINSIELKSGGPPRSLIPLANKQCEFYNSISVISLSDKNLDHEKFKFIKITYIIKRYCLPNLKSIRLLYKNIKSHDLIHIHNWWNFLSTFSLIFSGFLKKKIVISPHGSLHKYNIKKSKFKKLFIFYFIEKFFIKNIDAMHYMTNDEFENCFFQGKTDYNKIILPNSISINTDYIKSTEKEKNFFLYMGRLAKNKNVDFMVNVFNFLKNDFKMKKFSLIIMGPDYGEKKNLLEKIKYLKLDKMIKIYDPIYSNERLSFILDAKAVLLASDYECNSIAIAEALSLGTVVISTEECNTKDISNYGASITTYKNEEIFAKEMIRLFDEIHFNSIKLKAKEYANNFLNLDKNTHKLVNFYKKL